MNAHRFNQIAMAVLFALLLFFGTRTIINIAFEEGHGEKPGLEVATDEKPKDGEKPAEEPAAAQSEVIGLLATADPAAGEADAGLCKVCHTFDKGGAAMIGPNLYGVLGRKIASVEGFNYTPALKAHEGDWTYEQVDAFITNPQVFAPGTMMAFPGIPDVKKRANVIAFIRSKSDDPLPLPEAGAAPAEDKPAAAEEEKPAAAEEEKPAPAAEEEKPAPAAEEPAAETPAPAEEEKPAPAEEPAAAEEPAPSAAEEPAPAEAAPVEETPTPSAGEEPNPNWPQPEYPDGQPDGAEAASGGDTPLVGEPPNPNWPQPEYPEGSPAGQ